MSNLTDRVIRGMRPEKGKRETLSDKGVGGVRGLSIMANYGGSKVFYFRYKTPEGILKRIRLGGYPSLGLAEARKKAREFKRSIDNGADLATLNPKSNLTKRDIHTIQQLWLDYYEDVLPRKKSAKFEDQLWNKHLRGYFGELDLRSFSRDNILDFLIPYRRKHSPALSARIQAILSQLGSYAVERRVLEFSPAYQLGKKQRLPTCDRYLSRFELAKFWTALSDDQALTSSTVSLSLANSLKLSLCTCARRGEVAGMEWSEFDLEARTWTIPSSRTKNGRVHVVPLTDMTIDILKSARETIRRPNSRFVFPGRRTEKRTIGAGHIRADAITRACSRLCETLASAFDIEKFTPHDLRRTGATYMASALKVDRFTISQLLNHSSDHGGGAAVTGIYARYDYLEEKTQAMEAWTSFIEKNSTSFF